MSGNQEECQAFPLEVSVDTLKTKHSVHTETCLLLKRIAHTRGVELLYA
jgi:hypothetical protein